MMNNSNQTSSVLRWVILVLAILVLLLLLAGNRVGRAPKTAPGGGGMVNPPASQAYVISYPLYEGVGIQ